MSSPRNHIDLNADLGEGVPGERALVEWISSANVACGGHAGDEATMRSTLELTLHAGVNPGAHPGFADRIHFGRLDVAWSRDEVFDMVLSQVRRLEAIARDVGARLSHVKPHGALYNMAARDPQLARAVAEAVLAVDPRLRLFGLAGSHLVAAGRAAGLRVASEVFADRTYQADGSLTPRQQPDAFVTSTEAAVSQVMMMVNRGCVRSTCGQEIPVEADTVCIHGDGPHAVAFAEGLHRALAAIGVQVRGLGP